MGSHADLYTVWYRISGEHLGTQSWLPYFLLNFRRHLQTRRPDACVICHFAPVAYGPGHGYPHGVPERGKVGQGGAPADADPRRPDSAPEG